MRSNASYVVTGGGRGVGRAVVERLLAEGAHVVTIELEATAAGWFDELPEQRRIVQIIGDASDEAVAAQAAERAQSSAPLAGWVNNAASFKDASLHSASAATVLGVIGSHLDAAVAGCSAAVRAFLAAGTGGSIVNVSSHQAQRPVPGCLPYATAKSASHRGRPAWLVRRSSNFSAEKNGSALISSAYTSRYTSTR
ncbi:MAG: SDR family NAD(P)-dependent oxidoreductase, partial [Streptomyces sp.]|uniref:SDR family NAD(P)-dependent oxidoreductase n=1 Tax=Streptomyces sp. TaxID=1931 RepID=UPI003D6A2CB9